MDQDNGNSSTWRSKVQVAEERKFIGIDAYKHVIDSGVDAVILTTWPPFRPVQMAYAVDAGKHIFAEKAVAVDASGIRSVLVSAKKAKAQNTALQVGFCWRYHQAMGVGLAHVLDGSIGDITTGHTTYNSG